MQSYVQIENAGMVFSTKKGKFTALTDINLHINQGEFIALIGHSGCGKSTLLNLVAGLLDATDGVLLLANKEIKGPGPERGVVFQNHSLLPWLTAFENVHLAVEKVFGGSEPKKQMKARTAAVLELVG
ncbi:MAG: ATP-binding cassette domain-containing protein, partial [Thiobacillus sp.]|nr:ATP-binding cassette domain-containing protein [Thiobacillus sp.]